MDRVWIHAQWPQPQLDLSAAARLWDGKAAQFAGREPPTPASSLALRIISGQRLACPGGALLDVGCGAGGHALALAPGFARVEGVDLSPAMVHAAQEAARMQGSNARFECADWHLLDVEAREWRGAFDLVLANMTPAIQSAESFEKLSACSRRACLWVAPTRRVNSVGDALLALLDLPPRDEAPVLSYAFALCDLAGFRPQVAYEQRHWETELPLARALEEQLNRLSTRYPLSGPQRARAGAYLASIADQGMVRERVDTLVAALWWRVDGADGEL